MISAHFGSPTEPLYGVHHRPEAPAPGTVGAVLCPPVFHEGTNSHRALRNLADQFARAGMHALRFDYRGSGDSAGGEDRFRVANCVEDILAARDELRDARGLSRVGLVGLRLGASFAALAAQRCRDLPFLVLWEPIAAGRLYLQELRRMQAAWVDFEAQERPAARRLATDREALGYPLPPELVADLEALELAPGEARIAERTLLVDEGVCERLDDFGRALGLAGSRVEHRRDDGGRVWTRELGGEQAPVPRALLTHIVDWAAARDPS